MKYSKILGAIIGVGLASTIAMTAHAAGHAMKVKVVDGTIPKALTDKAGDAAAGRKLSANRKKGNCLACHAIADLKEQPFHGEVGPPLDDIGSRSNPAELRARLVDAKIFNPDTIMPSFHMTKTNNIMKKWKGKTILSAQEVEDIIAYLMTLKGSYSK